MIVAIFLPNMFLNLAVIPWIIRKKGLLFLKKKPPQKSVLLCDR